jgi:hypothetical protein
MKLEKRHVMARLQKQLSRVVLVSLCATALCISSMSQANERHFAYTYETATLPKGAVEFEPWTTVRYGREDYYLRLDHRFEFEFGLTDTLQMAFYINVSAYAKEIEGEGGKADLEKGWKMPGISSEWKWKLLDPVADALGLALYLELSGKPHEFEVETKILMDKRWGNVLLAFNAVFEAEWENEGEEVEGKFAYEFDLGLAYALSNNLYLGLELRNKNTHPDMEGLEHSALFAGPVISYSTAKWWATLSVMPQVYAFKGATDNSILDLDDHERLEVRLLLGIHL